MIWTLGVAITLTIASAVALFVHKRRIGNLQVGHYGVATDDMSVASPVAPVQTAPSMPLPPVQPSQPFGPPVPPQMPVQPTPPPQSSSPEFQIHDNSAGTYGDTHTQEVESDTSIQVNPQLPEDPKNDTVEDPFYK